MSVARPARCLFTAPSKPTALPYGSRRTFTTSSSFCERRHPRFASVKAADLGLISTGSKKKAVQPKQEVVLTSYTDADKKALSKKYTPEQLRVIEAGEEAISDDDLKKQGRFRSDHWRMPYLDDLSVIKPVLDKKPKGPKSDYSPEWRWMNQEERVQNMADWLIKNKDKKQDGQKGQFPSRLDWWKWSDENRQQVGYDAPPVSSLAPEVPKIKDPRFFYKPKGEEGDEDGSMENLRRQTGMSTFDIKQLKVKILVQHRVVNQTRLGKIQSLYVLAIAGNGDGRLGIGEGKATEPDEASKQAKMAAIRNMKPIPRYENRTIYGEVEGKVSAAEVKLMARPPGMFSSI